MSEASTVELLNSINDFNDISEYMNDEEITQMLVAVAKIISKPDIPPNAAARLIVQIQAYSAKFAMLASWYANVKKDDRAKKNIYYSAREALDKLADALKYSARSHYG
jgi:uncharacterized protein (UPF0147 family)